jgi:hypothetical protein
MHIKTLEDDELPGLHAHQAETPIDQTPQGGTVQPVR